jgi:hypothetical protein
MESESLSCALLLLSVQIIPIMVLRFARFARNEPGSLETGYDGLAIETLSKKKYEAKNTISQKFRFIGVSPLPNDGLCLKSKTGLSYIQLFQINRKVYIIIFG